MPCMVSETGLRLMPNRKDWQPEDTQVETAALTSSPVLKGGDSYTVRLNEGLSRMGWLRFLP